MIVCSAPFVPSPSTSGIILMDYFPCALARFSFPITQLLIKASSYCFFCLFNSWTAIPRDCFLACLFLLTSMKSPSFAGPQTFSTILAAGATLP